jgi:glycosyltransferase involved in cell wall biosynthesis
VDIYLIYGGDLSRPAGGTDRIVAFVRALLDEGFGVNAVIAKPSQDLPSVFDEVDVQQIMIGDRGILDQPIRAALLALKARGVADEADAIVQVEHATLGGVVAAAGVSDFVLDMHDLSYSSPHYTSLPLGSIISRLIYGIERWAVRSASDIVVVSEKMKEKIVGEWTVNPQDVTVISNGYFANAVADFQGVDTVTGRVVFLGNLHPKLDIEAIVETARLPETEELIIIGEGNAAASLREVKRTEDHENLQLMGYLPDDRAFELVASAAVAINPQEASSHQEASSPVKLNYYGALGTAMVVTGGPSYAHDLEKAGGAVVVPPGGDFAGAVQGLLRDGAKREVMAKNARTRASKETWSAHAEELIEVYRDKDG